MAVVKGDLLCEHVLPQMSPQLAHAFAFTDQPPRDEIIRPAKLIKNGEEPLALRRVYPTPSQGRQHIFGKFHRHGLRAKPNLFEDESIEFTSELVEDDEQENGLHQLTLFPRVTPDVRYSLPVQLVQPTHDGSCHLLKVGLGHHFDRAPDDCGIQFGPSIAEWITKGALRNQFKELAII